MAPPSTECTEWRRVTQIAQPTPYRTAPHVRPNLCSVPKSVHGGLTLALHGTGKSLHSGRCLPYSPGASARPLASQVRLYIAWERRRCLQSIWGRRYCLRTTLSGAPPRRGYPCIIPLTVLQLCWPLPQCCCVIALVALVPSLPPPSRRRQRMRSLSAPLTRLVRLVLACLAAVLSGLPAGLRLGNHISAWGTNVDPPSRADPQCARM